MFSKMAAESGDSAQETGAAGTSSSKSGDQGAATDASFQETIRRTMERMQASGDQATAAAATSGGDDFMSELLKQMSSGDLGGEGSEEEFSKMLMGMMEQLTNKEILYEPMKELDDKFPEWFEKNKDSTPAEDLKRYEEQKVLVREIVAKFEESGYSDSNAADREYIVDRMQKVREIIFGRFANLPQRFLTHRTDAGCGFTTVRFGGRHGISTRGIRWSR
jgi:peroxin-19